METDTHPLSWDAPFTPAMAARAGISRSALDRLHRDGEIRRLVRGVYVDTRVRLTQEVRARAVGLRLDGRQVVARRTAAWIYGVLPVDPGSPVPVDVYGVRSRWGSGPPLGEEDVTEVAGLRCTSPVRTALDLARFLAPEKALPLLDALLRTGVLSHADLLAASAGAVGGARQTVARVRNLTARADGRAADEAESVLRLQWLESSLPTPTPGLVVAGARLALGVRAQRFGTVVAGTLAPADLDRCVAAGWRVLPVPAKVVLGGDPVMVGDHLERAFHEHLLSQLA